MPGNLTLKQRLAALNINDRIAASMDQLTSPRSPGPKWRPFLPRRNTDGSLGGPLGEERVDEVMSRLVFQAGVDYETRPMVVMNASALPDPKEVSYDLLLSRILAYLNLYVESDYTVVFFAAGGRHTPGWNWVWKAYRSLSRKYRKNLKRLIIVHPSFFTKMLFSLAGAFISPKFFKKICYAKTLSELASDVPITQIDIPPAVYQENLKHEQQIIVPIQHRADLFGVPLEEIMGYNGEKGGVPRVVKDAVQFLRATGMQDEGLFRKSPSDAMLKQVVAAYDRGHVVSLDAFSDPHLAAVLIKRYLRELPEPVFPPTIYATIRRCPSPSSEDSDMSCIMYIRETLLPELPQCSYILLSHILHLLHEVSLRASYNLMDAYNLSRCVTPTLARSNNVGVDIKIWETPGGPSMQNSAPQPVTLAPGSMTLGIIIVQCIDHYFEIFDEVPDRTEARPMPAASVETRHNDRHTASLSLPSGRNSYIDDEDSIDDAMLVMPVGPSASGSRVSATATASVAAAAAAPWPPSAWKPGEAPAPVKYRVRQRAPKPPPQGPTNLNTSVDGQGVARSMHTTGGVYNDGNLNASSNSPRARSTISIEKGGPFGTARKGTITIGRGASRKGSGSAVEALGVTANGFFTPPSSAPPVPSPPSS